MIQKALPKNTPHLIGNYTDSFPFQNPDIVLVHYLNVPYPDDNKLAVITPSLALWADKKEWTKDELVSQLKPMFFSEDEPDLNNELEISVSNQPSLVEPYI